MKPVRIQRKRIPGYNMQEHSLSLNGLLAVSVTRTGKWGNPFRLIGDMIYYDASPRPGKILSKWVLYYQDGGHTTEEVVKLFRDLVYDLNSHEVEPEIYNHFKLIRDTIRDLEGKNVACWCRTEEVCHGDVYLEFLKSFIL